MIYEVAGRAQARAQAATAPQADDARKVVLAFEGLDVGRRMLAWAAHFVLFPDDEVFVVICSKARAHRGPRSARRALEGCPHTNRLWAACAELARIL